MMKRYFLWVISFFGIFTLFYGCVEPFSPPEINSDEGYLVVDGFLNVGSDTTLIELSHTQNINAKTATLPETGAKLSVEQEEGESFSFTEKGKGAYVLPPQTYNISKKYRLRIKTKGGGEYVSEYVEVKDTPAIDTIEAKPDPRQDAMTMYVNTHDVKNQTRFYRWKFEETWEYRTVYKSYLDRENGEIVNRKDDISLCWRTTKSKNILLGSTIKLSQDIIKDLPLTIVPIATNKFFIKYSILVKQYGLTQGAFEYWTSLAKTTEGTGSLFDPLPSQVTGNIRSVTNPKELVFGYFSASVEREKRIFLTLKLGQYPRCMPPDTLSLRAAMLSNAILLTFEGMMSTSVTVTSSTCADCRVQGGVINKPLFWE